VNRIAEVFGTSPVLLPVVHPISRTEALAAVAVAHEQGVKGVFLIDQGMTERDVVSLAREVRTLYPALWIGINLLSRTPAEMLTAALTTPGTIDGIWSDNAGIDERVVSQRATVFGTDRRMTGWRGLYFGGVAFKYQREIPTEHLGRVATSAAPYMDVVCTSGPGTGYAADVEKVRALRAGLGDHAMALASGVTPENVRGYMPYVQAFLVGTGIEKRLGILDPAKIEALMKAMG
jgi:predicted TIM-barrel enzyme